MFCVGCSQQEQIENNHIVEENSIIENTTIKDIITTTINVNTNSKKIINSILKTKTVFAKFNKNTYQESLVEEEIEEVFYFKEEPVLEEIVTTAAIEEEPVVERQIEIYDYSPRAYEPDYFEVMGVLEWGGWRWTWYSQQVLPGDGLDIPGRHVDSDGYVCDENDYICLASDYLEWGTVVNTPFGKMGRVYDCGPGAWDILDVYVDW